MWAILYKNYKIINIAENLIGQSNLVQNFKEIGQEQALVETPSYWKILPECQNLLSMAITGHEKVLFEFESCFNFLFLFFAF